MKKLLPFALVIIALPTFATPMHDVARDAFSQCSADAYRSGSNITHCQEAFKRNMKTADNMVIKLQQDAIKLREESKVRVQEEEEAREKRAKEAEKRLLAERERGLERLASLPVMQVEYVKGSVFDSVDRFFIAGLNLTITGARDESLGGTKLTVGHAPSSGGWYSRAPSIKGHYYEDRETSLRRGHTWFMPEMGSQTVREAFAYDDKEDVVTIFINGQEHVVDFALAIEQLQSKSN